MNFICLICFGCFIDLGLCLSNLEVPASMKEFVDKYQNTALQNHFEPFTKDLLTQEFDAKIIVPRKRIECVFERCSSNSSQITFSFQSYSPASMTSKGTLDGFAIFPNKTIARDSKGPTSEKSIEITCEDTGMYGFCLDNSHDSFVDKEVDFQVTTFHKGHIETLHRYMQYSNDTLYSLYDLIYQVTDDMTRSTIVLYTQKAHIGRDYNLLQGNYVMISVFSLVSVILIISISYGQVHYLKRLINRSIRPANGHCATRL